MLQCLYKSSLKNKEIYWYEQGILWGTTKATTAMFSQTLAY